jgi:hypothetical protein
MPVERALSLALRHREGPPSAVPERGLKNPDSLPGLRIERAVLAASGHPHRVTDGPSVE